MTSKRTHRPCSAECNAFRAAQKSSPVPLPGHLAGCPALYPAQQEPDALTRLVRHVRQAHDIIPAQQGRWREEALSLISEAREEQRKAAIRAKNDGIEAVAREWDGRAASLRSYEERATGEKLRIEWAERAEEVESQGRSIRALKDPEQ